MNAAQGLLTRCRCQPSAAKGWRPLTHRSCHDAVSGLEQASTPAGSQAPAWATDPAQSSSGASFRRNDSLRGDMLSALQHAQQQQAHPWLQQVTRGGRAGKQQAEHSQAFSKCCLKLVLPSDCSSSQLHIICLFHFYDLQGDGSSSEVQAAGAVGPQPRWGKRAAVRPRLSDVDWEAQVSATGRAAQHMWVQICGVGLRHRCESLRQVLFVLVASNIGPSGGTLRHHVKLEERCMEPLDVFGA